eukprot:4186789-Pyramimonas_sp.AAC.1
MQSDSSLPQGCERARASATKPDWGRPLTVHCVEGGIDSGRRRRGRGRKRKSGPPPPLGGQLQMSKRDTKLPLKLAAALLEGGNSVDTNAPSLKIDANITTSSRLLYKLFGFLQSPISGCIYFACRRL